MWTDSLRHLSSDARLLFATRFIRLFAYGALSVVLVLYLVGLGLSEADTGVLLTATLIGDTLVSLYLTTQADRIGRRPCASSRDRLRLMDLAVPEALVQCWQRRTTGKRA